MDSRFHRFEPLPSLFHYFSQHVWETHTKIITSFRPSLIRFVSIKKSGSLQGETSTRVCACLHTFAHTENKVLFASTEALEQGRAASPAETETRRAVAPGRRHPLSGRCPLLALQHNNPQLRPAANGKGTGSPPHTKIHASSEPQNVRDSEFCSPEKHPRELRKTYNYFKWPHSPSSFFIVLSINVHISWRNCGDRPVCTPPGESRNLSWPSFSLDSEARATKPLASFRSRLWLLPLCGQGHLPLLRAGQRQQVPRVTCPLLPKGALAFGECSVSPKRQGLKAGMSTSHLGGAHLQTPHR